MKPKTKCQELAEHADHMCELESQQEWETMACITDKPAVYCTNCGARANAAKYVCMPEDL